MIHSTSTPANPAQGVTNICQTCQGNGEIVTDWDTYLHGDDDEKATATCPDCDGEGKVTATIGAGGQAVASVDDVAARLWKADAEDSGTPASVAKGRTREAFDDQSDGLKDRWRKFANAAFSALTHPAPSGQAAAKDVEKQAWECDKWPAWLHSIIDRTNEVADRLDMSSEQAHAYAALSTLSNPPAQPGWREPSGHVEIAHDGFAGDIIGHYVTREGKRGVVVQQDGTRVVHVYGEKWLPAAPLPTKGGENG